MQRNKTDRWSVFFKTLAGAGAVGGAYLIYNSRRKNETSAEGSMLQASTLPKLLPAKHSKAFQAKAGAISTTASLNFDAGRLAEALYQFATRQNIEGVISVLQQVRTVAEYTSVNEQYKALTDKRTFVKQTIVTGLLDKYFSGNQQAKDRIKSEFLRMGLKLDNTSQRWSLSGIAKHRDLVTLTSTLVTDWMGNKIAVKADTILGDEKDNSNGLTRFIALDGKVYKVPSKDVKYLSHQY